MKNTKSRSPIPLGDGPQEIDWAEWMAYATSQPRGRGGPGRKLSPEQCKKLSAAQKLRFQKKREAIAAGLAAQRIVDALKPAPYDPLAYVNQNDRLLGSMQPGAWYSTLDMSRISGVKYQSCKAWGPGWFKKGILLRAQNPAWKPPERVGAKQEPKWLYRLSPEGERRHRLSAALL